jgi:hypothetical protein
MSAIETPVQVSLKLELDNFGFMVDGFGNVNIYCLQHSDPLLLQTATAQHLTPLTNILNLIAAHQVEAHS